MEHQPLTDIAAMNIGRILSQGDNITKLSLGQSSNPDTQIQFTHKTGEYIGQALLDNPSSSLHRLDLENIYLGETGLQRIIEAANACKSMEKLMIGVITDTGLRILAAGLKSNCSLEELEFSETPDHQKYWTAEARQQFVDLLKHSTKLKKVKVKFQDANKDEESSKMFEDEIEFYTEQKNDLKKKDKKHKERMESCEPQQMFESMSKYLENTDKNEKMPVRKFFNNTFGQMLNDAIFALQKKMSKATGEEAHSLQFKEGQVKFVAFYMLNKLPEGELVPEEENQTDD